MSYRQNIYIVDDDPDFLISITRLVNLVGFQAQGFGSLKEMKKALEVSKPDILILDLNLPGESTFDILPDLRNNTNSGIILLSGLSEVEARIQALEKGADIYLTKPIDIRELTAVINTLTNRLKKDSTEKWVLDETKWTLTTPNGIEYKLTTKEFKLISLLAHSPNRPFTREAILEIIGNTNITPENRTLDVLVSRLRKKINQGQVTLPVRSIRYVGYVFYEPIEIIS
ncbi:MAG: response regulator transcription factor [Methylocystaceae bacterium]|nr:response regulator transcription factor [Methylocystaceae bacterium]